MLNTSTPAIHAVVLYLYTAKVGKYPIVHHQPDENIQGWSGHVMFTSRELTRHGLLSVIIIINIYMLQVGEGIIIMGLAGTLGV